MRKQYYFRPSPQGFYAWDVDRLIELTKDFAVKTIGIESIRELDENCWFDEEGDEPTVRAFIDHARLIEEANLDYPIILSEKGRVMDGMHRVGKALLLGRKTIDAVQFKEDPEPDFVDVHPDDLTY